jgi:hypothetical protein
LHIEAQLEALGMLKSVARIALLSSLWLNCACDTETRLDSPHDIDESRANEPASEDARDSGAGAADAGSAVTEDAGDATSSELPEAGVSADAGCWQLPVIDRVRLYPAAGKREALAQGKIEGSNTSAMNDFVTLGQVLEAPRDGEWVELRIDNPAAYRYVKYYAPSGSHGALAEIELYAGEQRVRGKAFGSSSASDDETQRGFERALDGDTASAFEGPLPDDNYVGLDLAAEHILAPPTFSLGAGSYAKAQTVALSAEPNAQIYYTIDGRDPRVAGIPYSEPLKLDVGGTLVRAVATRPCAQPSEPSQVLYQIGGGARTVQSSLHIGNSLTDTIVDYFPQVAKSGGITLDFNRYTIPGAGTWLYQLNPTGGFGVPDVREALRTRRFDHISLQPFPNMPCQVKSSKDGADSDSGYIQQAYTDARTQNPSVQLWVYQQWPAPREYSNCLSGGGWTRGDWHPSTPKSWEEAVKNELSYQEAVRAELLKLNPNAPPPYIVPAGNALVALKHAIESGSVPGLTKFFEQIFAANGTDVHLTKPGAYFVTLVFHACMFQKTPEGTQPDATFGVSKEQAARLQQIAWQAVLSYPLSGVSR